MNTTVHIPDIRAQLRGFDAADFERAALELFRFQFEANSAYRLLCESRSVTPNNLEDWSRIPASPASAFKEFDFSCVPPDQRVAVFHSSGTTGQKPSRHHHSRDSLALYEESLLLSFRRNVVESGPIPILALSPTSADAPHSSLVHMFETVRHDLGSQDSAFLSRVNGDGEWVLDLDTAAASLARAHDSKRPVCILGTAFSFVHLLEHLQSKSLWFNLAPGSVVMETGGYKGKSRAIPRQELHHFISRRLGVPSRQIVCEYGMSELSSQAYAKDSRGSRIFHFPPWARVQIISPETGREVAEGETGLVRIFDLANAYSVLALQTEDLAIKRGDGFELLGRSTLSELRGCSLMSP